MGRASQVTLMGGVYRPSETLVLTPEDSGTAEFPVLWQASPGQEGGHQRRYAAEFAMGVVP